MAKAISNEIRKQALELFKKGLRSQAVAQMLAIDRTVVSSDTRVNPTNDTRTDPFFVIKNNVLHVI